MITVDQFLDQVRRNRIADLPSYRANALKALRILAEFETDPDIKALARASADDLKYFSDKLS